jgi:Kef-type K+ transport system membrane component KefB
MTHPEFRLKVEAVGFGVFITIFFVTSGVRFDLSALFASPSTVARAPLFLLAVYLARGLPAIVYVRLLGRSGSLIAGVLQATTLPFVVAATQIGLGLGVVSRCECRRPDRRGNADGGDLASALVNASASEAAACARHQ